MARNRKKTTIAPVQAGDFTGATPEFGRWQDVNRIYSIKRGTAYNLLHHGKIKGVLLRVCGKKSGVRLFDMASVRNYTGTHWRKGKPFANHAPSHPGGRQGSIANPGPVDSLRVSRRTQDKLPFTLP